MVKEYSAMIEVYVIKILRYSGNVELIKIWCSVYSNMHIYGICLFLWKANVIGYLVDLCVCTCT